MSKKIERLKASLEKKENAFDKKLQQHFSDVAQTNGQPLNDKRNGAATMRRFEQQNDQLRSMNDSIRKIKEAIEWEQHVERGIEMINEDVIPGEIIELVEDGVLVQWRKHPTTFFVAGVDRARIVWDVRKKVVAHRYADEITDTEQRKKFVRVYNSLNKDLNH